MCTLPGMVVSAPKDGNELRNLIATALLSNKNFSIRYPKDSSRQFNIKNNAKILEIGKWETLHKGTKTAVTPCSGSSWGFETFAPNTSL